MVNEVFKDANDRMVKIIDHYSTEIASIRTGRANPGLVESVKVDYYGSMSPLKNISQIKHTRYRSLWNYNGLKKSDSKISSFVTQMI